MTLHVTNGASVGDTLRSSTLGGDVLTWDDALHEGPVPALPRAELLRTRSRFLSECGWGAEDALLSSLEARDRALLEAFAAGRDVVLWFEHDLYDQLQLLDILSLAHEAGAVPDLIVVGSFLGPLTAGELEALWPSRRAAEPAALETAAEVWAAFRAPEPARLREWASRSVPELPFLAPALRRLLEELDGLSGTERRALAAVAGGARTPGEAFVAAQRLEDAPFLGDTWFFRALSALSQGPSRLIDDEPLRLTEAGERVLRGEADRVELLGVDRWVGGTHLVAQPA
jgi:Domain of unknown function (DUF1835)